MDGWMDGWVDGYTDGWMDVRMSGWIYRWVDGCTDGWMDIQMGGWMSGWTNKSPTSLVDGWKHRERFTPMNGHQTEEDDDDDDDEPTFCRCCDPRDTGCSSWCRRVLCHSAGVKQTSL